MVGLTAALNRELSERETSRKDEAKKDALREAESEAARTRR
jgi:hypothetical protein